MKNVIFKKDYILINPQFITKDLMKSNLLHTYFHLLLSASHERKNYGTCQLSIQEIANSTGIKEKTVYKNLQSLQHSGRIEIEQLNKNELFIRLKDVVL